VTTTAPTTDAVLDDTDRRIIAFIFSFRREHLDFGPTWSQVRAHVPGLKLAPASSKAFDHWFSNGGREIYEQRSHWGRFRRRYAHLDEKEAFTRWRRQAFNYWLSEGRDPLAVRLTRLRNIGYLAYNHAEGSLDVGPVVRNWAQNRQSGK
jgi:hypothetical protein